MLNRLTRCMLASSEIQVSEVETLTELETSELPTTTSSSSSSDTSVDWSYWLSPVQQPASDTTSKLQLSRWHKHYSTSDCLVLYQQSINCTKLLNYLVQVLAMAPCLFICTSHKSVFYRMGRAHWSGFWHDSFFQPVLHCVIKKFRYIQKNGTFLWNFFQNSRLRKFRHGISIVETSYQLSWNKVDAQSVIN